MSDVPATEAFGAVHPGEVELRLLHGGQGLERSVLVAPVDIVRPGHRHAGEQLGLLVQKDEAVGVAVRQRAQEDGVDRAEDRRVRPDAERQREDSHQGEAGVLDEHPQGEAQILEKRVHLASPGPS